MTAAQMIAESTATDSTIHAAYSEALHRSLLVECEDTTERDTDDGTVSEYWGTTEDGGEWRVHLTAAAS